MLWVRTKYVGIGGAHRLGLEVPLTHDSGKGAQPRSLVAPLERKLEDLFMMSDFSFQNFKTRKNKPNCGNEI